MWQDGNKENLEAEAKLKLLDSHKPCWLRSYTYAIGICNFLPDVLITPGWGIHYLSPVS